MNLFEEINFFKDYAISINIPILLSLLFIPSLFYNMFPFIILLSGIWFFRKIKKTDEAIAMRISGLSNISIIFIPSIISIILGIFFVTSLSPITSTLVKKYENLKGSYEKDQDYLAAITVNGIWIKEKKIDSNKIIRASSLSGEKLLNVTIYEFDENENYIKRLESKSANIKSLSWILEDVQIIDKDGILISEGINNFVYKSMYDIKKIKSLYSNLDTISFWNLNEEIKLLEDRGYSSAEMQAKLHRSLSFPFFLLSMLLLSGLFTFSVSYKEHNWTYVFVSVIASVIIFYFNDFSAALGKTGKLPIEISVWMPIAIIFIFSAVGLINVNQK